MEVPIIDVAPLADLSNRGTGGEKAATSAVGQVARQIDRACREVGFFSIVGHGVDPGLLPALESLSREFFARPVQEKALISMDRAGRAWRGWFPLDGELTSGVPDHKEGIYFGEELSPSDARVLAGLSLHGPNLFPDHPVRLRQHVLAALDALRTVGQQLCAAIGVGLGLGPSYFHEHLTADPIILMRVFHYPAVEDSSGWGVAEHTDYGLLTLLHQDRSGGLQVHAESGWIDVDPVPGALVCNLGDMLERMTGGAYRATPHRVAVPNDDRVSIPFFFDPSWDAEVRELPIAGGASSGVSLERWDGTDLSTLSGTYGEYLVSKVAKVFPELRDATDLS